MLKGKIVIVLLVGSLMGCETMFHHYKADDKIVVLAAQEAAEVSTCGKLGYIQAYSATNYVYQVNQLLEITVYDEDLYKSSFQERREYLDEYPGRFLESRCTDLRQKLPGLSRKVSQMHERLARRLSAARAQELNSMLLSVAAGSGNTGLYTFTAPHSNQVTYEQNETSGGDYLVNTPSGSVLCNVSDSGYVNCY